MHEGETLKAYSDRYWEVYNELDDNHDDVAISIFKSGLPTEHDLRKSLTNKPVTNVHQLMNGSPSLVDNGSSADILYYPAFQQMRLGRDQLRPIYSPLVGFGGMKVQPVGTISLSVVVGAYPQQITKDVNSLW